jgi:hypothetical protein
MPITISHVNRGLKTRVFQQVTVSTTAVGLSLPAEGRPKRALITVNTNAIRYRTDGVNPTTTNGHLGPTGASIELIGETSLTNFRMIRNAAADAEVAYSIDG